MLLKFSILFSTVFRKICDFLVKFAYNLHSVPKFTIPYTVTKKKETTHFSLENDHLQSAAKAVSESMSAVSYLPEADSSAKMCVRSTTALAGCLERLFMGTGPFIMSLRFNTHPSHWLGITSIAV